MTRKPVTSTGRGLVLALRGEWILGITCVAYFVFGFSERLLVAGFAVAGLLGFVSVIRMWKGQLEFGPEYRRLARRGTYLYVLAGLLFVLAFLSFQTFPSMDVGTNVFDNNTTSAPEHRFRDLIPPVVLLATAVSVEVYSGATFLWHLVGDAWRRWVVGYAGMGGGGAIAMLVAGIRHARQLEAENGPAVATNAASDYFYDLFLTKFLSATVLVLLMTRIAAVLLVRHALQKVAEAEVDYEPGAASETGPSP